MPDMIPRDPRDLLGNIWKLSDMITRMQRLYNRPLETEGEVTIVKINKVFFQEIEEIVTQHLEMSQAWHIMEQELMILNQERWEQYATGGHERTEGSPSELRECIQQQDRLDHQVQTMPEFATFGSSHDARTFPTPRGSSSSI